VETKKKRFNGMQCSQPPHDHRDQENDQNGQYSYEKQRYYDMEVPRFLAAQNGT